MRKHPFVTVCACFYIFLLLRYPQVLLEAGSNSAMLWFTKVLPSLFPFMVACGLLMEVGVADSVGRRLQPFMKPIFCLPGIAAFPFFMGIFSGYPLGAKMTAVLYEEEKITLVEGEHILTFSNNAGPLFLVATVGAGFFQEPMWGYVLLACSVLGAISTGIVFRFFIKKSDGIGNARRTRKQEESFGVFFPRIIANSLHTVMQIGGYIVLFSIATTGLMEVGFFEMLSQILFFVPVSKAYLTAMFGGILEMTNGCMLLSGLGENSEQALMGASFLVSFGGLSILFQTFGILERMPIRKHIYVIAKVANGICSAIWFVILYPKFALKMEESKPVFLLMERYVFSEKATVTYSIIFLLVCVILVLLHKKAQRH